MAIPTFQRMGPIASSSTKADYGGPSIDSLSPGSDDRDSRIKPNSNSPDARAPSIGVCTSDAGSSRIDDIFIKAGHDNRRARPPYIGSSRLFVGIE